MTKKVQKERAKELYFDILHKFTKGLDEKDSVAVNKAIQAIADFEWTIEELGIVKRKEWDAWRNEYKENHAK